MSHSRSCHEFYGFDQWAAGSDYLIEVAERPICWRLCSTEPGAWNVGCGRKPTFPIIHRKGVSWVDSLHR